MKKLLAALSAALLVVSAACGGSDGGGTTPPPPTPTLTAGVSRDGAVNPGNPVVTYRLDVPAGVEWRVYVQARGAAADTIEARVGIDGGASTPVVRAGAGDALEANGSAWMPRVAGQEVRVEVRATRLDVTAPFTVKVVTRSHGPETAAADLPLATPVSETIGVPEDFDEFFVTAGAQEVALFLRGMSGSANDTFVLLVEGVSNGAVQSPGNATSLQSFATGRLRLPAGQRVKVTVFMLEPRGTGAYQVMAYPVNASPETLASALVVDQPSAVEGIAHALDVDEFTFTGRAGQMVNVLADIKEGLLAGAEVSVSGPGLDAGKLVRHPPPNRFEDGLVRVELPADGTYRVRVAGAVAGEPADATGAYRLLVQAVDRAPENVPPTLTPGVTVTGEWLNHPGDVDEWTLTLPEGARPVLAMTAIGSMGGGIVAQLVNAAGEVVAAATVSNPSGPAGFRAYSEPNAVPAGTYRVRVTTPDPAATSFGEYELRYYTVDARPETAPQTVQPGTWMGETIHVEGDLDEYALTLPEGTLFNVRVLRGTGAVTDPNLILYGAHAEIVGVPAVPTGLGRYPAGPAPYRLVMRMMPSEYLVARTGGYQFRVDVIDRAPEGRSAAYAIGQTVESMLDVPGDIDEYTFTAAAGDRLRTSFTRSQAFQVAQVVEVSTGTVVSQSHVPATVDFVAPSTGTYLLRVWDPGMNFGVHSDDPSRVDVGAYTVSVTRR